MTSSLNHLKNEFRSWRETRSNRSETPAHLKEKVRELLKNHKKSDLVKQLGVSYEFLNRLQPEKPLSFVTLPKVDEPPVLRSRLIYKNLHLELDGDPRQIAVLMQALEGL